MKLLSGLSRRFWYLHYKQAADMPLTAKLHADIAKILIRALARGRLEIEVHPDRASMARAAAAAPGPGQAPAMPHITAESVQIASL